MTTEPINPEAELFTTTKHTTARKLVERLTDVPLLQDALFEAWRDYRYHGEQIVRKADEVMSRATRAAQMVQNGQHVNVLGEIQSAGADLDRACTLREHAGETMKQWLYAARNLTEREEKGLS